MQNTDTPKKLSNLELLPTAIKLEVLNFFAPKQKKAVSGVSRELKKIVDADYSGPFYMIGNSINIGKYHGHSKLFQIMPRHKIYSKEIIQSFPQTGPVKLFITQTEAELYARALRTPQKMFFNASDIYQSAVFKVNLYEPHSKMGKTHSKMNPEHHMIFHDLKEPPVVIKTLSFEVENIDHIIPILGTLEVDFYGDKQMTHYGVVNGVINEDKEQQMHKCVIA